MVILSVILLDIRNLKVLLHKLSLFLWQSLHYRNQHWTICSLFDVAHILITGGITTNAFSLWLCWVRGKSEILSYQACLRAGMLFRMAASPAHISSHVVWSRFHTSESVSRSDPEILWILILHSLMYLVVAAVHSGRVAPPAVLPKVHHCPERGIYSRNGIVSFFVFTPPRR